MITNGNGRLITFNNDEKYYYHKTDESKMSLLNAIQFGTLILTHHKMYKFWSTAIISA